MDRQRTIRFAIWGPLARPDLAGLCARVGALLETACSTIALCDVGNLSADAVTVEALARLQLAARRSGCQVRLRGASNDLCDLVAFVGLQDVLTT